MGYERVKVYEKLSSQEREELEQYSKDYIRFLSTAKTERLASKEIVRQAEEKGFVPFDSIQGQEVKPGQKFYAVNKNKGVALFVMGKNLTDGMDIVGSHIDCPRLDLKAVPLHEEGNMAYLRTHYYGGVKKYQWTTLPLALHGIAFTKEGKQIDINIGEEEGDPVFYINDLLIHLSREQMAKTGKEIVTGEQLQVVCGHDGGNRDKDCKDPVKENILKLLKEKYDLEEEDFQVAEIEVVPAGPAREVGFDRSLIAGHGHDDRICSYANLRAILETENPERTAVALLVDKEEIGSVGNTGMHSKFFENLVSEVLASGKETYNELEFKRTMANSRVLSADVTAAYDPMYPDVFEKDNSSWMGCGITVSKYTGSGGKGGSNDANAEFLNELRQIFQKDGVIWQTGELGKIDAGGGGTIAYILAEYGAEVVDCGTGMLSMHAPIELASKADAYETYRAYRAFFR